MCFGAGESDGAGEGHGAGVGSGDMSSAYGAEGRDPVVVGRVDWRVGWVVRVRIFGESVMMSPSTSGRSGPNSARPCCFGTRVVT